MVPVLRRSSPFGPLRSTLRPPQATGDAEKFYNAALMYLGYAKSTIDELGAAEQASALPPLQSRLHLNCAVLILSCLCGRAVPPPLREVFRCRNNSGKLHSRSAPPRCLVSASITSASW